MVSTNTVESDQSSRNGPESRVDQANSIKTPKTRCVVSSQRQCKQSLIKVSLKSIPAEQLEQIDAVIALDCTWHQAPAMIKGLTEGETGEPLAGVTFISLKEYTTTFWRYQHHANTCLATVEAIYYFYKELEEARQTAGLVTKATSDLTSPSASGSWKDLLFLYAMQYYNLKRSNVEKAKAGTVSGKHKDYINRILNQDKPTEDLANEPINTKTD